MSGQLLISDEERLAFEKLGIEGDLSESTVQEVTERKSVAKLRKRIVYVGPPKPDNRDGMGRYKVPVGGKPLTVQDIPGPGPGHYDPDYTSLYKKYPMWTLGEKDGDKLEKGSPSPNKYNTGGSMKWGKCKTFTMKQKVGIRDQRLKYPGPTDYDTLGDLSSGPAYTMRLKPTSPFSPGLFSKHAFIPDPRNPGPNYNLLPEEWLKKPQTFGIKHNRITKPIGPGPQKYAFTEKPLGPKWAIGERIDEIKNKTALITPGPQAYTIKSEIGDAPKYTMGNRIAVPRAKFITPGPDTYNSAGIRLDEPGFTLKYRWFEPRQEKRPGPYTYKDDLVKRKNPRFTMAQKVKLTYPSSEYSKFSEDGPGPSQYDVPREALTKGKTFGVKHKDFRSKGDPGPADYQDTDVLKVSYRRAPAFTMARKTEKAIEKGPGPGSYNVKFGDSKPGKSFGIRFDKTATGPKQGPEALYSPVDPLKLCGGPCDYPAGPTLKSRHTPHKYTGLKDTSLIPPQPANCPPAPLLG